MEHVFYPLTCFISDNKMKGKWNTLTIMHVFCGKYTISELVYPELVFARQSTQKK